MKKIVYIPLLCLFFSLTSATSRKQEQVLPDFDTAMYCSKNHQLAYEKILKNPAEQFFIALARKQYAAMINIWPWQETPKIPKIIHQIWVGPHPIPETFKQWQALCLKLHPNWNYKLWTDKEVANLQLINQTFYDITQSYGEKANILRYELLYHFGGVYLDTDFECIKPLDFLHHVCDFYAGFEFPQADKNYLIIGNAVLGSRPAHPLIKLFIERMKHYWHNSWQPKRSGTFFVTDVVKRTLPTLEDTTILLPANFFYPWIDNNKPWQTRNNNYRNINCPESLGFHHWDLTWQTQK